MVWGEGEGSPSAHTTTKPTATPTPPGKGGHFNVHPAPTKADAHPLPMGIVYFLVVIDAVPHIRAHSVEGWTRGRG